MKRRVAIVTLTLAACVSVLFVVDACTIVNGLVVDVGESGPAPSVDAGDASDGAVDPCVHARPPSAPPFDPTAPQGAEVFVVVATAADFGIRANGMFEAISFDLDGVCTCLVPPGMKPVPGSCNPNGDPKTLMQCDTAGGEDNGAQGILNEAVQANLDFAKASSESVNTGGRSILIRVQDYNGQPNDSEVRVSVLVSPGLYDAAGTKTMTPTFTTADTWSVDMAVTTDRGNGVIVPNVTTPGYVVDSVLVVNPPSISLPVSQVAVLTMTSPVMTAKVVAVAGGHTLGDVAVAGRWSVAEAIRVVGSFEPSVGAGRLCEKPAFQAIYDPLKQRICQAADLRSLPADDNKGKDCDAVSVAVKVTGKPASLGPQRVVDTTGYCADAGVTCPK